MRFTFYLDRKQKPETAKAQIFFAAASFFEGMVISFLTIFLNECRKQLGWTSKMSSLSLFLPPFGAAIGIFICSFFVSHQKTNLKVMRGLICGSFVSILVFSLLGIFLPTGLNPTGEIVRKGEYYALFALFVAFSSILMGLHWAFLSFHASCAADINVAEGSRYGHICLYGVLMPAIASPLAGYIAESYFIGYKGYLFLFLVSSPLLILLFGLTFIFKPFPSSLYHSDSDEHVPTRLLFQNKNYVFYLFLASLWIPLIWASDSLTSSLWSSYESLTETLNSFNPLTWGIYLGVSYLFEFLFVFINTHFGIGKKIRFSLSLALGLICIETFSFGLFSYFFVGPEHVSTLLVTGIILIHSLKGMASGLYVTSNLGMLNHILGPKLRRKAVFVAPLIFQLVNSLLQLCYPYFTDFTFVVFFVMSGIACTGVILSAFLDVHLLHHPEEMKD